MKVTWTFMLASFCCLSHASSSQNVQKNAECQTMRWYFQIMGNETSMKTNWDERNEADRRCPAYCYLMIEPDGYLSCTQCANFSKKEENCPYYGKLAIVEDRPVVEEDPMRALHTLPYGLFVTKSSIPGAGLGVFTSIDIPAMVRFGPYGGSIHDDKFKDDDAVKYSWTVKHEDGTSSLVNAENASYANYLRYVNMPTCVNEQNMYAIQHDLNIYYVTINRIRAGNELFVWYGNAYAAYLGLDKLICNEHIDFQL